MKAALFSMTIAFTALAAAATTELGSLTWWGGAQTITADTHVTNLVVNGATTVLVDAGSTLTVDFLKGGGMLTKRGNGALVVRDLDVAYAASGLNIVKGAFSLGIRGGGLEFPDIASSPFYRVDAMRYVDSLVHQTHLDADGNVNYWEDARDNRVSCWNIGGVKPKLSFAFLGGKPVVDFGAYTTDKAKGAGLQWNKSVSTVRETFIVAADTDDVIDGDLDGQWHFGDNTGAASFYRGEKRRLARLKDYSETNPGFYYGLFELDGAPATYDTVPSPGFHIIHQRTNKAEGPTGKATHWAYHVHGSDIGYGGLRIAEAMLFTNALTEAEARAVTQYLKAKWLDGPSTKSLGSLKVSGDATLDLRAGDALTVGTLTVDGTLRKTGQGALHATVLATSVGTIDTTGGTFTHGNATTSVGDAKVAFDVPTDATVRAARVTAAGTFAKTGAGTLEATVLAGGVTNISVAGGTFRLLADDGVLPSGSHYRVDAANKSKLYVQSDGTCSYWEGMEGYSAWATHARPRYSTAEMDGRASVDFGSYSCAKTTPDGYGGAFQWNGGTAAAKGVFVVFADSDDVRASDTINGQNVVGCFDAGSFNRGADHALLDGTTTSSAQLTALRTTGVLEIDGVTAAASTILPKGFHLVHMRLPTGSEIGLYAQSWGYSRYSSNLNEAYYGGMKMAEGAIYTRDLTEAEVASATKYFLNKWFRQVREGDYAFGTLSVADGATLDLGNRTVTATGLGGRGTLAATGVSLNANAVLALDADANGIGKLKVTGAVALPAAGTVTLGGVPPKGTAAYTVLEAGSLSGDVSGWTVDAANLPSRRTASLRKTGNTLVLTICAPGLILLVQ